MAESEYKVIETSRVTDEELERILNEQLPRTRGDPIRHARVVQTADDGVPLLYANPGLAILSAIWASSCSVDSISASLVPGARSPQIRCVSPISLR